MHIILSHDKVVIDKIIDSLNFSIFCQALEFLQENYREFGIVKLERLSSGAAFQTYAMHDAKKELKKALQFVLNIYHMGSRSITIIYI